MYGPCCTFNTENKYVRTYALGNQLTKFIILLRLKKRNFKNRLASPELGLTVVLNSSLSDYFSPILNTNGYIVLIHNADDYATVSSSNTLEMFPGQGEDTYLQIYARVVDTDDSLKSFSPFGVGFSCLSEKHVFFIAIFSAALLFRIRDADISP